MEMVDDALVVIIVKVIVAKVIAANVAISLPVPRRAQCLASMVFHVSWSGPNRICIDPAGTEALWCRAVLPRGCSVHYGSTQVDYVLARWGDEAPSRCYTLACWFPGGEECRLLVLVVEDARPLLIAT